MWFPHQVSVTGCFLRHAAFKLAALVVCSLALLALLAGESEPGLGTGGQRLVSWNSYR